MPQLPEDYKFPCGIEVRKNCNLTKRPIVAASTGCNVKGVSLPHPDPECHDTMIAGVKKRLIGKPPNMSPKHHKGLKKFVKRWLKKNLTPLARDTDLTLDTWLAEIDHPQSRKDCIRKKYEQRLGILRKKDFHVTAFMKDEHYTEYKHARGIYSRSDQFKAKVGPIFRAIEKEVFKHPAFIKKIPVDQRAKYVMERLYRTGKRYIATDYTSFESHFIREVMEICEFQLYKYMTQYIPQRQEFWNILDQVLAGLNVINFRDFTAYVIACRMSGEMCTSLGNGFSNLMLMMYACQVSGARNIAGVVEGDDGLFVYDGNPPTIELFKEIGFTIKLEIFDNISEASFCGLIFDETDEAIITEPLAKLVSFGYVPRRYALSKKSKHLKLLRAKSLSFLYQYPGCPILRSLALYGLRISEGYRADFGIFDSYHMNMKEEMLNYHRKNSGAYMPIGFNSRLLMERKFGITVAEQLKTEAYLDSLNSLQELEISWLNFKTEWLHYDAHYCHAGALSTSAEYPDLVFGLPSSKERFFKDDIWGDVDRRLYKQQLMVPR